MEMKWLQQKTTIEELEAKDLEKGIPIGESNSEWRYLVSIMQDGDELWTFSSPVELWKLLCGRAGVALVRNGEIVESVCTVMN